jgi:integrase
MPKQAKHNILLRENVMLYKRFDTDIYYVRFKIGDKWIRKCTKSDDVAIATETALDMFSDYRAKAKQGFSIATAKFASIANEVLDKLKLDMKDELLGTKNNYHYIKAIEKYLIPYFKNISINTIGYNDLEKFNTYVDKRLGREMSRSTHIKLNVCLNKIFQHAMHSKKIHAYEIPKNPSIKKDVSKRGSFTIDEHLEIQKYLRSKEYLSDARQGNEIAKRKMLRHYTYFLSQVGIRNGTESANLKWKHITKVLEKGDYYYKIYIPRHKTKEREVVARDNAEKALMRIYDDNAELTKKYKDFDILLNAKVDEYVFRKTSETRFITNIGRMFSGVLQQLGLKYDKTSEKVRTLYSYRHFYIAQALLDGIDITVIADNCGTSIGMIEKYYKETLNVIKAQTLRGKKF